MSNIFFSFRRNFVLKKQTHSSTRSSYVQLLLLLLYVMSPARTDVYTSYEYTRIMARAALVCVNVIIVIYTASVPLEWTETSFVHDDFIVLENKLYIIQVHVCIHIRCIINVLVYWIRYGEKNI